MKDGKATITDVAKHCGISVATVSRIINNVDHPVSEKTRQKVLDAVEELNYSPNILARYLKSNRMNEVGVVVPHISNYYYSEIVAGINDSLLHSGFGVLLCDSYRNPVFEKKQIVSLLQKQVRGIIFSPASEQLAWDRSIIPKEVTLVAIEQPAQFRSHSVSVDHEEGGRIAARHLINKGHTRIAFASSPLNSGKYRKRMDGFKSEMKAAGLEINLDYIRISDSDRVAENTYEFGIGVRLANNLMRLATPPTAVICTSDTMAMGMVRGLRERGVSVPGQMAVVGFDNLAISDMAIPSLTTVDQCVRNIGAKAVEIMLKSFASPSMPIENILFEPQLIEREST